MACILQCELLKSFKSFDLFGVGTDFNCKEGLRLPGLFFCELRIRMSLSGKVCQSLVYSG